MYEVSQNVDLSLKVDALSKKFDQLLALNNTLPINSPNVRSVCAIYSSPSHYPQISCFPNSPNNGNHGKEDADSTCKTRLGDAANRELCTIGVSIPSDSVGATPSGSATIFESDSDSLRSSSIDIPNSTSCASGPSTNSPFERLTTGTGSLSGIISLRE
ncbi:hypothetical protein M9H77_16016 [Catharanthus roseus]|uniref:Uncharacterized protein n=1 Tax=Catharanthus roseus TaxID=4058 RepID=A0ACC0AYS1_CATRO|nr:hypothetical protein M9H77_16016 [Catharanthus roseus]